MASSGATMAASTVAPDPERSVNSRSADCRPSRFTIATLVPIALPTDRSLPGMSDAAKAEPAITPELIAQHGLKPDEYQRILDLIGREPTFTELGIFSAMWNE